MRRLGLLLCVVLAVAFAGCGSSGGSSSKVSPSWAKVDSCIETNPSFIGNVIGTDRGGPGGQGGVSVARLGDSAGFVANGYRFSTAAAAAQAERGIGPPGPTVSLYGQVALEIHGGVNRKGASEIRACFDKVYGLPTPASRAPAHRATSSTTTGSSNTTRQAQKPASCYSSHNAYAKCATAAAPYCQQGQCSYPLPSDGVCASGYTPQTYPTGSVCVAVPQSPPPAPVGGSPQPSSAGPPTSTSPAASTSQTSSAGAGGAGINGNGGGGGAANGNGTGQ